MPKQLIECVPNISEGRNYENIQTIAQIVETVEGVKLLDIDSGKAANRTVITFVGEPKPVVEAAFRLIKKAAELIDMRKQKGEHPRFGATDVCPLIPISGITLEETVKYAHQLGQRVGKELGIPVYFYEAAAKESKRKNLANCRAGEYESLPKKFKNPKWKPDFGPLEFNDNVAKTGAIAISARDFLIAYNINLNTTSAEEANIIASKIRESGIIKREGNLLKNKKFLDSNGRSVRIPGKLKAVKGIGWFIKEFGIAQVSYNLTDISTTPIHTVFEETVKAAEQRGLSVTGSELVGLIPLKAMLGVADYFLAKHNRSLAISESEKIHIAIKALGLDDVKPFNPQEKIIEYAMMNDTDKKFIDLSLTDFADITSSNSIAPSGGSVAAYTGALGAALGIMVAQISSHKKGWEDKSSYFSDWVEKGQEFKNKLLFLVDEDSNAYGKIIEAYRMPKQSEDEKRIRKQAIETATKYATEIPYQAVETAYDAMKAIQTMVEEGLPSTVSDAAVGVLCARTTVVAAYFNVRINAKGLSDRKFADEIIAKAENIYQKSLLIEKEVIEFIKSKM